MQGPSSGQTNLVPNIISEVRGNWHGEPLLLPDVLLDPGFPFGNFCLRKGTTYTRKFWIVIPGVSLLQIAIHLVLQVIT